MGQAPYWVPRSVAGSAGGGGTPSGGASGPASGAAHFEQGRSCRGCLYFSRALQDSGRDPSASASPLLSKSQVHTLRTHKVLRAMDPDAVEIAPILRALQLARTGRGAHWICPVCIGGPVGGAFLDTVASLLCNCLQCACWHSTGSGVSRIRHRRQQGPADRTAPATPSTRSRAPPALRSSTRSWRTSDTRASGDSVYPTARPPAPHLSTPTNPSSVPGKPPGPSAMAEARPVTPIGRRTAPACVSHRAGSALAAGSGHGV